MYYGNYNLSTTYFVYYNICQMRARAMNSLPSWITGEGVLRLCEIVAIVSGLLPLGAVIGRPAAGRTVSERQAIEREKLRLEIATQQERAAKAETALKEVSDRVFRQSQPRWGFIIGLAEILKLKPKGNVEILYVANDEEAYMAASVLELQLRDAGWHVIRNVPISEKDIMPVWKNLKAPLLFRAGGEPGITVVGRDEGSPVSDETPSGALINAIIKLDVRATGRYADLPNGLTRLIVASKP